MALHVTDTSKTIFQHTRADGRVEEVEGYLGTGYDDSGRAIFGEVSVTPGRHQILDRFEFTHRCYQLDENLDLRTMATRGLALDAGQPGTNAGRVEIRPEHVGAAISNLHTPIAALRVGDEVKINHGVVGYPSERTVVERNDTTGDIRVRDTGASTALSRKAGTTLPEDVWFSPDGQLNTERSGYVEGDVREAQTYSLRNWLSGQGSAPVVAPRIDACDLQQSQRPQLTDEQIEQQSLEDPGSRGTELSMWREDIDRIQERMGQWNPYNPEIAPRIERVTAQVNQMRELMDRLEQDMGEHSNRTATIHDVASAQEVERMDAYMANLSESVGVPRTSRTALRSADAQPSAATSAAIAELRSRYEAPAADADLGQEVGA